MKKEIEMRLNVEKTTKYLETQIGELSNISRVLIEETIKLINDCHSLTTAGQFVEKEKVLLLRYPILLDDILEMLKKADVYITPHMLLVNDCFESDDALLDAYLNSPRKGDVLEIISMKDEPQYSGRCGTVEHIDDAGQIHGSWGGCALIPGEDTYKFVSRVR